MAASGKNWGTAPDQSTFTNDVASETRLGVPGTPFDPSTGDISVNVGGTFTQGQSTQVGLVSSPTTRFQIGACDSWCLSGKGYTSTWEMLLHSLGAM